jgi:RNA polymerase sigma-70 factor (ECF subfamily)
MSGQRENGPPTRTVVYCVIPRDLAELHDMLRRHFRGNRTVEVIVEQRVAERRRGSERRGMPPTAPVIERRRIRSVEGRRVVDRRSALVSLDAPALPRRARPHAGRIVFVERQEPTSQHAEDLDTARIVMRIQAGEVDEFARLYARYFARVYGWLRVLFRDEHEAENATQDVFIQVLESLTSYERRPGRPFRAWLFTVARNHALNEIQRLARMAPTEPATIDSQRERGATGESFEALGWISDPELLMFVERLPVMQRQVLALRYMLDFSDRQIAELLECSPGEVRMLRSRALRFLRQRLDALTRGRSRSALGAPWRRRRREAPVLRSRRFSLTP